AVERFHKIPFLNIGIESYSDWVANILLFIPLGFLGMATFCVDRRRGLGTWLLSVFWIVLLFALSVSIEFTQIFFPPRTVSQNDIQAETLGAIFGPILWLLAGQILTAWVRKTWNSMNQFGQAALWLPGYLAILVFIHVMPLDLTISPVEVYHKWKEGKI